ncbi:DinB family protein [Paenibacillus sp. 481]|uniref:DinB family protein n=1 Tax=Paenibacillus sp. 481 TaxID=2835869 RepID=UPI001E63CA64|nr:DinB family protein [Paenibacillus sp. 481]UHA75578.1 DinB family protein [Paenibacillus sp. 481]
MKQKRILGQFLSIMQQYEHALDTYTFEQLVKKPSAQQWSLGEMYNHIIETGLLQIAALKKCVDAPKMPGATKTWKGKVVFMLGSIPPIRAKVPESAEHTAFQPTSKEELKERLQAFAQEMRDLAPQLEKIDSDRKVEHPYFGHINAIEWYDHILMHVRHHLRQKKRLDAWLNI